MTIYISGGSNSLKSDGWTSLLAEHVAFENLSVGATSSAMGAYRAIFYTNLQSGDTLIWEYALNDLMHLQAGKAKQRVLLRFCEYTIRHCLENNITFIPFIFVPRAIEKRSNIGIYRKKLQALFTHYGITYVDVSTEFRAKYQIDNIPMECFLDSVHYDPKSEVVSFIVSRTLDLLAQKMPPPKRVDRLYTNPERALNFVDIFEKGLRTRFENSICKVDAWGPDGTDLTTIKFTGFGKISAIIVLLPAACKHTKLTIRIGDQTLPIAAKHNVRNFNKTLLRALVFPNDTNKIINFRKNDRLSFAWERPDGVVPPETEKPGEPLTEARIVGLLVEQKCQPQNKQTSSLEMPRR